MAAALLVLCIIMPFSVSRSLNGGLFIDPFESEEIIETIKNMEINMTSVIYVKNAEGEWEEYHRLHGEENRIWVDIEKVPQKLIDAFIAIEDERFYNHKGVDWKRTTLAVMNKYLKFGGSFGGSTITQQLIKNLTSDKDKTSERKVREIVRALTIEKKLSKTDILEAYLNTISLGNGICGVQVAANYYFNKDIDELTLSECASIAAITKNPSAYNPISNIESNTKRRNTVLDKMYELGKISKKEYTDAKNSEVVLDSTQKSNFEPKIHNYFVDALIENVIDDLSEKYGCSKNLASTMLYNGGFQIYSTMDMSIQSTMEDIYSQVSKYFPQKAKNKDQKGKYVQSAMTIMDYQGHIVGIVGGVGEKTTNRGLNRAMNSPRQPGSTMKPLGAYAPALELGLITPTTNMVDSPLDNYYPDGKKGPQEWYGYYAGTMTIAKALERSANTIPCKIVKEMGAETSYNFLTQKLGFKYLTEKDINLSSMALGGCDRGITTTESASAYAIFGNNGKFYKPVTYYSISRPDGTVVLEDDKEGTQVIAPATATIMHNMLQNVVYGYQGTGRTISSYSKMKAYAKTGTSSDCNDLWMVAGTPYYVGSVWYGFDYQEEIYNTSAAANVWKAVMTAVHKDLEYKEFTLSEDVEIKKYCTSTGLVAGDKCYSKKDGMYIPGVEVKVCDGKHYASKEETETTPETPSETPPTTTPTPETPPATEPPSDGNDGGGTSEPPAETPPAEGEENTE